MKNEEAKTNLEKLLPLYDDDDAGIIDFSIIRESVKVAIEALEKQNVSETNVGDLISRQAAIDAILHLTNFESVRTLYEYTQEHVTEHWTEGINDAIDAVIAVPSAQPEIKPIEYLDCTSAMLKMWMDNVLTDGEYNRIMDKLNEQEKARRTDG